MHPSFGGRGRSSCCAMHQPIPSTKQAGLAAPATKLLGLAAPASMLLGTCPQAHEWLTAVSECRLRRTQSSTLFPISASPFPLLPPSFLLAPLVSSTSLLYHSLALKRQRPEPISSIISMRAPPVYRRSTTPVRSLRGHASSTAQAGSAASSTAHTCACVRVCLCACASARAGSARSGTAKEGPQGTYGAPELFFRF